MSADSCSRCGATAHQDAQFCHACGTPLHGTPTLTSGSSPVETSLARVREALAPEWTVLGVLGRGGMGAVYLAREEALERTVAVKVLPESAAQEPDRVERFLREARTVANLRHPNIVPIHAAGERRGVIYFTMAHVDGKDLARHVHDHGTFTPEEAVRIVLEAAKGIHHAHERGVLHRDIKPSNIMLQRDGSVVVMDFGLARRVGLDSLTSTGSVQGTPQYVSPEQLDGVQATERSDIYALGLVLFFMLAGRNLVDGDELGVIVRKHIEADLSALVQREPRVSASLRPVILSMIDRDPERRPRSMARVIEWLSTLRDVTPAPPAPAAPRRAKEPGAVSPAPPRSPPPSLPTSSPRARTRKQLSELLDKLERDKKDD